MVLFLFKISLDGSNSPVALIEFDVRGHQSTWFYLCYMYGLIVSVFCLLHVLRVVLILYLYAAQEKRQAEGIKKQT